MMTRMRVTQWSLHGLSQRRRQQRCGRWRRRSSAPPSRPWQRSRQRSGRTSSTA
jgi:hypothetical protein